MVIFLGVNEERNKSIASIEKGTTHQIGDKDLEAISTSLEYPTDLELLSPVVFLESAFGNESERKIYYRNAKLRAMVHHYGFPIINIDGVKDVEVLWRIKRDIKVIPSKEETKFISIDPSSVIQMRHYIDILDRNKIPHAYLSISNEGNMYVKDCDDRNVQICVESTIPKDFHKGYAEKYGDFNGDFQCCPYVSFCWKSTGDVISPRVIDGIVVNSVEKLTHQALRVYHSLEAYYPNIDGIRINISDDGLTVFDSFEVTKPTYDYTLPDYIDSTIFDYKRILSDYINTATFSTHYDDYIRIVRDKARDFRVLDSNKFNNMVTYEELRLVTSAENFTKGSCLEYNGYGLALEISKKFPDDEKYFLTRNICDVDFAWSIGFIPVVSINIQDCVARMSINSPRVSIIYQSDNGEIVDTDNVRVFEVCFTDPHVSNYTLLDNIIIASGNFEDIIRTCDYILDKEEEESE